MWRLSPDERNTAGIALGNLTLDGEPRVTASGEWEYRFRCDQTSELREGDAILLSDGPPGAGSGRLRQHPASGAGQHHRLDAGAHRQPHADRPASDSDIVHDRTVRNLWRWLEVEPRLRALVAGRSQPAFDEEAHAEAGQLPPTLNAEQRQAVARALAAHDFVLVQGPPGTGKTSVVAEIVKRAVARGERVLVAAFTNQAVDNVLRRLVKEGFTDMVRPGDELSVAAELHPYRLLEQVRRRTRGSVPGAGPDARSDRAASPARSVTRGACGRGDDGDLVGGALRRRGRRAGVRSGHRG